MKKGRYYDKEGLPFCKCWVCGFRFPMRHDGCWKCEFYKDNNIWIDFRKKEHKKLLSKEDIIYLKDFGALK